MDDSFNFVSILNWLGYAFGAGGFAAVIKIILNKRKTDAEARHTSILGELQVVAASLQIVNTLNGEMIRLDKRLKEVEDKNTELQEKIETLSEENQGLEKEISDLRDENIELKERCTNLERENRILIERLKGNP